MALTAQQKAKIVNATLKQVASGKLSASVGNKIIKTAISAKPAVSKPKPKPEPKTSSKKSSSSSSKSSSSSSSKSSAPPKATDLVPGTSIPVGLVQIAPGLHTLIQKAPTAAVQQKMKSAPSPLTTEGKIAWAEAELKTQGVPTSKPSVEVQKQMEKAPSSYDAIKTRQWAEAKVAEDQQKKAGEQAIIEKQKQHEKTISNTFLPHTVKKYKDKLPEDASAKEWYETAYDTSLPIIVRQKARLQFDKKRKDMGLSLKQAHDLFGEKKSSPTTTQKTELTQSDIKNIYTKDQWVDYQKTQVKEIKEDKLELRNIQGSIDPNLEYEVTVGENKLIKKGSTIIDYYDVKIKEYDKAIESGEKSVESSKKLHDKTIIESSGGKYTVIPPDTQMDWAKYQKGEIDKLPTGAKQTSSFGFGLVSGLFSVVKPVAKVLGVEKEFNIAATIGMAQAIAPPGVVSNEKFYEQLGGGLKTQLQSSDIHYPSALDIAFEPIGLSPKGSSEFIRSDPYMLAGSIGAEVAQAIVATEATKLISTPLKIGGKATVRQIPKITSKLSTVFPDEKLATSGTAWAMKQTGKKITQTTAAKNIGIWGRGGGVVTQSGGKIVGKVGKEVLKQGDETTTTLAKKMVYKGGKRIWLEKDELVENQLKLKARLGKTTDKFTRTDYITKKGTGLIDDTLKHGDDTLALATRPSALSDDASKFGIKSVTDTSVDESYKLKGIFSKKLVKKYKTTAVTKEVAPKITLIDDTGTGLLKKGSYYADDVVKPWKEVGEETSDLLLRKKAVEKMYKKGYSYFGKPDIDAGIKFTDDAGNIVMDLGRPTVSVTGTGKRMTPIIEKTWKHAKEGFIRSTDAVATLGKQTARTVLKPVTSAPTISSKLSLLGPKVVLPTATFSLAPATYALSKGFQTYSAFKTDSKLGIKTHISKPTLTDITFKPKTEQEISRTGESVFLDKGVGDAITSIPFSTATKSIVDVTKTIKSPTTEQFPKSITKTISETSELKLPDVGNLIGVGDTINIYEPTVKYSKQPIQPRYQVKIPQQNQFQSPFTDVIRGGVLDQDVSTINATDKFPKLDVQLNFDMDTPPIPIFDTFTPNKTSPPIKTPVPYHTVSKTTPIPFILLPDMFLVGMGRTGYGEPIYGRRKRFRGGMFESVKFTSPFKDLGF